MDCVLKGCSIISEDVLRQEFSNKLIYGIFFSHLGSGGRKKKSSVKMTS